MASKQKAAPTVNVPLWMSGFYFTFPFSMAVWITHLLYTIPSMHLGIHWQVMWSIFDGALLVQGAIAAYLLIKKSAWACLPLASLATLFVVDMWFDLMTSITEVERAATLKVTVATEIPLAILSAGCAVYILRQVVRFR
jgi:hypothetical protein